MSHLSISGHMLDSDSQVNPQNLLKGCSIKDTSGSRFSCPEGCAGSSGAAKSSHAKNPQITELPPEASLSAGDALEDDFELDSDPGSGPSDASDEEGSGAESAGDESAEDDSADEDAAPLKHMKGTLQERRQARAAGKHPLQHSFRAAAASLLAKHGIKVSL